MRLTLKLKLILGIFSFVVVVVVVLVVLILCFCRRRRGEKSDAAVEREELQEPEEEKLIVFNGGNDLTIFDILEAPGEVIGKSSYGTLYKAHLRRTDWTGLLRFLRPICTSNVAGFNGAVRILGDLRNPHLVPLLGFYSGPRGEKLLVHPYFKRGNLSQLIKEGDATWRKWGVILKISLGIVKGLDFLHNGNQKVVTHGNLKSRNVFLNDDNEALLSDFGIHTLLNSSAGQEVLDAAACEGYKAPELMKMKDANGKSDVFSLGVIMLELLSGRPACNESPSPDEDTYLLEFMEKAVLNHRLREVYHPDLVSGGDVAVERVIRFFELAMSCCAKSPGRRPSTKQILSRIHELGRT